MSEPWKPSIDRERELRDRIKGLECHIKALEIVKEGMFAGSVADEERIAELESVMQEAREVIERQRDERLNLEAENQRLRDVQEQFRKALSSYEVDGYIDTEGLAALLGGGE